jgi:DNA-binding CsgD family transcriptional regulator
MDAVRRSIQLLSGTDELNDDPRRLVILVLAPMLLRESGTGRELISRAVEESRQRVAIGTLPRLLFHLARDEAVTDRWAAASSEYYESIRLARETGQSTELAASLAGLGWLQARQGRAAECVAHLEEAARLCDDHQIHLFRAWCHHGLGDLAAGQGLMEPALVHFDAMATHLDRTGIRDVDLNPAPERVEILVRLGRQDAARDAAAEFLEQARAKGQPWALARAERSMALCESGDRVDERLAAAIGWHDRALDEYERAKTLLALGSHRRRSRRRAAARGPLRTALSIFDALGAAPAAALAGGELQATGENPQPRGASLLADLTPQEVQIATMLANGRTTKQTAAALFLSPKTVEYHLRHVYTKLNLHSREALARLLNP